MENSVNNEESMPLINHLFMINDVKIGRALNRCVEVIGITICVVILLKVMLIEAAASYLAIIIVFSAFAQFVAIVKLGMTILKASSVDKLNLLVYFSVAFVVSFFGTTIYAGLIMAGVLSLPV